MKTAQNTSGEKPDLICSRCARHVATDSNKGSLTNYLFQGKFCACDKPPDHSATNFFHKVRQKFRRQSQSQQNLDLTVTKPAQPHTDVADYVDFCPRCGLTLLESPPGSMTGYLFQDTRCKCPPDPVFSPGSMTSVLFKLKQIDGGQTFDTSLNLADINAINLKNGAIIGGAYRIEKLIGQGGMGEVYLAYQASLDRRCALKIMAPEQVTELGWKRFQQEARAISKLDHLNVVKVTDLGIHENCLPFYAMEYVEGANLDEVLHRYGPMPLKKALYIFKQICDGVDFAHRNGIIHRDLKPANIMVANLTSPSPTVKILDFGLAKLTQADRHKQSLTSSGDVFGSPFYMSPEQCSGERTDKRSDIYSIGCTLFEVLTGRPPFVAKQSSAIILQHIEIEPPQLTATVSLLGQNATPESMPESMNIVMNKLLRKNPAERYQTANELKNDLERVERGEKILPHFVLRNSAIPLAALSSQPRDHSQNNETSNFQRPQILLAIICATAALIAVPLILLLFSKVGQPQRAKSAAPLNDKTYLESAKSAPPEISESVPSESTGDSVTAWKLTFDNDSYGQCQGLMTHDRANFDNGMVTYCVGAPDYDQMMVVNEFTKSYATVSLRKWITDMTKPNPFLLDKIDPAGNAIIAGIKCRHFLCKGRMINDFEQEIEADLYTAKDLPVTAKLADACAIFTRSPTGYGLPIQYSYRRVGPKQSTKGKAKTLSHSSSSHLIVELLAIVKTVAKSTSFAMPPKGFKKVESHLDLYDVTAPLDQ